MGHESNTIIKIQSIVASLCPKKKKKNNNNDTTTVDREMTSDPTRRPINAEIIKIKEKRSEIEISSENLGGEFFQGIP